MHPVNAMTFTEELRGASGDQWNQVINHKFTKELASGNIDRDVLKRYLIQDHRFLDAFVILLSSMISKARSLKDRIPGCQFLAIITGEENTYFERCFEKFGCTNDERNAIPDAECTIKFINLMKDVSSNGSLAEMLAVLVVCEWSYLSWGQCVSQQTNRDDFVTYEWVDLHSGEYFKSVVTYLRTLLDVEGDKYLSDDEKEKCKERFLHAVNLEEKFFENAYNNG